METAQSSLLQCGQVWLRSYLWGMETKLPGPCTLYYLYSDPTYKAWKPLPELPVGRFEVVFRSYLRGMETRMALQRKAWNWILRSYLRGMETRMWILRSLSHLLRVLILPMRHQWWNYCDIPPLWTKRKATHEKFWSIESNVRVKVRGRRRRRRPLCFTDLKLSFN